jgi:cyclic pyranopterin phosphate synthase
MTRKFIPINQESFDLEDLDSSSIALPKNLLNGVKDQFNRPLKDLRISVTDRCNFRCTYCMPKEVFDSNYQYLPHSHLLSFEEIIKLAKNFVQLGVQKIRLTGGEPLLRKNIEFLIEQLAKIKTLDGSDLDLTLTTNGSLLERKAQSLKDAGLQRVTVSLDGLDDDVFKRMNDVDFAVSDVLKGIDKAVQIGLAPLKVNMVVKRSVNLLEITPMTSYFLGTGVTLRFIEYMDVGATNGWRMDEVVSSSEIINILSSEFEIKSLAPSSIGETAKRYSVTGKSKQAVGEIGLISSVSQAFCGDCNRARLSTEGRLYMCLFASRGFDFRSLLRGGASDELIMQKIAQIWGSRNDRYSELRGQNGAKENSTKKVEMSYIGG